MQAIGVVASSGTLARRLRDFSFRGNAPTPLSEMRQLAEFTALVTLALERTPCLPPAAAEDATCGAHERGVAAAMVRESAPRSSGAARCGGSSAWNGLAAQRLRDVSERLAAAAPLQRVVVSRGDAFGQALAHALAPAHHASCVVVMV